ncbi:transcriptional repressor [Mycobacterium phage Quink]|nr:transcriptional repressor [Mycobacterium phage Phaux]YP_008531133.1 transcriptional repressor [Mycobacterium phage Quink]YP_008857545.1 transcriptional repressor [Mycobacterium phage PhatBacter]AEL21886.1 hypothetical protein ELPH10_55 [Mycobacterium phage Elph10]AVO23547.1 immunity repressor [Mycobacterium phage RiverMonster]AYQ99045.1 helix-turn-helix DNA binding protein [Mycobacterium phage BaboJay]AYQ99740.1 helix-turn-helix DNA binding protein [Mycobacterium phage Manda]QAY05244.1 he
MCRMGSNEEQWTDADRDRWSTYVIDWIRRRSLTRAQAAEVLGLSGSTMTQWCKHGDRPSVTNAEAFGEHIGGGAEEGRRMGGYPAAMDGKPTIEDVHKELGEVKAMLQMLLEETDPQLLTRKGVVTMMSAAKQVKPTLYREDAPPL